MKIVRGPTFVYGIQMSPYIDFKIYAHKKLKLVKYLGILVYSQPACRYLLTDLMFLKRLRDLMEHNPKFLKKMLNC